MAAEGREVSKGTSTAPSGNGATDGEPKEER
jgi:hypothetical protein